MKSLLLLDTETEPKIETRNELCWNVAVVEDGVL